MESRKKDIQRDRLLVSDYFLQNRGNNYKRIQMSEW